MSFDWLGSIKLANERKIGWLLSILRKQRNIADYDSEAFIDKDNAQNMVDTAKAILKLWG